MTRPRSRVGSRRSLPRWSILPVFALFALFVGGAAVSGSNPVVSGVPAFTIPNGVPHGTVEFSDYFAGERLNASRWNTYLTSAAAGGVPWNTNGAGGSGPEQPGDVWNLEYDLPSQVHLSDDLVLAAQRSPTLGMLGNARQTFAWRSGAVSTYGKFQFDGGFLEIEAKVPTAPGMWPSLWLLPASGSAARGDDFEIDLFEGGYLNGDPDPSHNFAWALHTPGANPANVVDTGVDLSKGFHVYGLDWVPGKSITWYLDSQEIAQVTSAQAAIPRQPMELIMNLQVAAPDTASFHTVPGASTPAADQMVVRAVRVYAPPSTLRAAAMTGDKGTVQG